MPRSSDPTVPTVQIDGFDQLEPIGRGGFSYVFSARQRDFNRRVAVKVLNFGLADERERRGFERECRAMGLVSQHPNIVTVFNAAFSTTKQPCIVMELYSGGTLGERLKRDGPLPVPLVLETGVKIAGALQTAHDRGLLHRDIKPQNLFVSEFGEPALGDFGISTLDDERSISGSGGLTVHYAPPEVLEGAEATAVSDVYSLAATMYTLLEGMRPFGPAPGSRQSVGELARRIMLEAPARVARPDAPRSLTDLLVQTMSKDPGMRPASAAHFGRELQRIQGELGLAVTALPVAATAAPDRPVAAPAPAAPSSVVPPPPPAAAPPAAPSAATPSVAPAASDHDPQLRLRAVNFGVDEEFDDDDDGHQTVTVARAAPRPAPPASTPTDRGDGGSSKRAIIGTAAAIVCLLAVAGSLLWFGGRDDDADPSATTAPTSQTFPQLDFGLTAPRNVTAERIPGDGEQGAVAVTWSQAPDGEVVDRYQVTWIERDRSYDTADANQLRVIIPDVGAFVDGCFTVTAIGPRGSISDPSTQDCI